MVSEIQGEPKDLHGQTTTELRQKALRKASLTLSEFVARDERARNLLADDQVPSGGYVDVLRSAFEEDGMPGVRLERRRRLAVIAACDASGELRLEAATQEVSDLAAACLQVALEDAGDPAGVAVIGMGKLGGRELNYSSDIDLMFVAPRDAGAATKTVERLLSTLGAFTPEGQAYRIDLNLRPEGQQGALVRSLESYEEYYSRWAKTWEYQALIKARPVAGDSDCGASFIHLVEPLVYQSEITPERVTEIRKMKERVEDHADISARRSRRTGSEDVKLGPGGIRDIEFSVQLFQLVHGAGDENLRTGNTLDALRALVARGYIAEDDGAGLEVALRWLRNVEHRLQLWKERQVHHLPAEGEELSRLARGVGFRDSPERSAAEQFMHRHHVILGDVRGRFEKLFYRPMIESLADPASKGLSREAIKERLQVLGFRDVDRAARTLEGLVTGTSRRAKLLRVLSPAILRHLSETPQPDVGLFSFLHLGEALQERLDVLGSLRDNPAAIRTLAQVVGSGRWIGDALAQVPDEVAALAAPAPDGPLDRARYVVGARASLEWREPGGLMVGLRRYKRREIVRVVVGDVSGRLDIEGVGSSLASLAEGCFEAAIGEDATGFAVVGMGKLGGRELGYASDLDVMFVTEGDREESERRAGGLLKSLGEITPEGQVFRIDADLRPEGKGGPLTRSLASFQEYWISWSRPWEHQALLKARFVAGDQELGARFIQAAHQFAFPERLPPAFVAEIRHLKARMEKERIPKGSDPRRNIKLGPGGISDIEFAAQMFQLQHGRHLEPLRVTGTIDALEGARMGELISESDTQVLVSGYRFLLKLRNRLFLINGRPTSGMPVKPEDLEALAIGLGFEEQPRQELEEEFLRVTRRARRICERVVYGAR